MRRTLSPSSSLALTARRLTTTCHARSQRSRYRSWHRRVPLGSRDAGRHRALGGLLQCVPLPLSPLLPACSTQFTPLLARSLADTPFAPGHITSNEPGYYEVGSYGIRLESVLCVKEARTRRGFGDRKWLDFERLTMVRPLFLSLRLLTSNRTSVADSVADRAAGADRHQARRLCAPVAEREGLAQASQPAVQGQASAPRQGRQAGRAVAQAPMRRSERVSRALL